jgi:hypothetical protein
VACKTKAARCGSEIDQMADQDSDVYSFSFELATADHRKDRQQALIATLDPACASVQT